MADPTKPKGYRVKRGTKGMTIITPGKNGTKKYRRILYTKQKDPMVAFRAGERSSRTGPKLGPPAPKARNLRAENGGKAPVNRPKRGATVGDALKAVGNAMWDVNRTAQKGMRSSPGLKSEGIRNVMKLPSKRK